MYVTALWDQSIAPMQWGCAASASLLGAIFDLKSRRIPNVLTLPTFVAALVWAAWMAGLAGLADALSGSLLVSAPYVVLFLLASGGAGDAKLMAAVGAWLGVINGLIALVCVAVSGVILAVILAAAQKRLRQVLSRTVTATRGAFMQLLAGCRLADASIEMPAPGRTQRMPYGPAIFIGVCVAAIGTYLWRQS